MQLSSIHAVSVLFLFFTTLSFFSASVLAQGSIPSKFDGFWYENRSPDIDSIIIEAFFDPVCPDSRDSWPPLKAALHHYGSRVSLVVHTFPLPYHDNAYVTSRALHIVDKLNTSATYPLLESIFKHQEKFYNRQTFNISRKSVVNRLTCFVTKVVGNQYYSAIAAGFKDRKTDLATRISFKYGCSRGVFGTPIFYVNGFVLPDGGSAIDFNQWRKIIDPLVNKQNAEEDDVHSSFMRNM